MNWTVYNTINSGLPENQTVSLTFAPDSSIWVSTAHTGIAVLNGSNWSYYNSCNSPLNSISSVADMKTGIDGRIYIGSGNGVNIVTYDNITLVQSQSANSISIKVFPNPTSDIIHFEVYLPNNQQTNYFEIINPLGSVVHYSEVVPFQYNIQYDVSHLKSGIYLAIFRDGKQILGKKMFVVY